MSDYSRDETEFGAFEDPCARRPLAARGYFTIGGFGGEDYSRDETEGEDGSFGNDYSRDETENEDGSFGGFFDSVLNKVTGKKKMEAKVRADIGAQLKAKGASPQQVASATALLAKAQAKPITAKDIGRGMIQTAKIGAAVASFVVPGGAVAGTAALGGLVAADKLIAAGQKGYAAAKTTLDTTKKLAAAGHVDSQRGLQMIGMAAAARAKAGIPAGVPQPVTAAGKAAYDQFLAARKPVVVKPAAAVVPPRPAAPVAAVARPVVVPPRAPMPAAVPLRLPVPLLPVRAPVPVAARPPVPVAARPPVPVAAVVAPRPVVAPVNAAARPPPLAVAPTPGPRDWLVHESGRVERIVRGNAIMVPGGGWYVGANGLTRFQPPRV